MKRLAVAALTSTALSTAAAQPALDSVRIGERLRLELRQPPSILTGLLRARGADGSITIQPPDGAEQRFAMSDIRWLDRATRVEVRGSPAGTVTGALIGSIAFPVGTAIGGIIGYRASSRLKDGWERLPVGEFPGMPEQLIRYRLNGVRGARTGTVVERGGDTALVLSSQGAIDLRRLAWLEQRTGKKEWVRIALPTSGFAVGEFVRATNASRATTRGYVIPNPDPNLLVIETRPGTTVQVMRGELALLERSVRRETSGRRGALIGLAAGTVVGIQAWTDEKGSGLELGAGNLVLFGSLGAGLGSVLGIGIPRHAWERVPHLSGARR